jgi:hypothetical protein
MVRLYPGPTLSPLGGLPCFTLFKSAPGQIPYLRWNHSAAVRLAISGFRYFTRWWYSSVQVDHFAAPSPYTQ